MREKLDSLDKKIVHYVCSGVHSYNDLAKLCGVGRNTIYRRLGKLEKMGIIVRKIMAVPDFEKLGLSVMIVGINASSDDIEKMVRFLKRQPQVKFLWKTYGTHDLIFVVLCDKEDVGECIFELKRFLEKIGVKIARFDVSVSVSWERIDLTPY